MQCTGFVTVNMYLLFTALSDHQTLQNMYFNVTRHVHNYNKSLLSWEFNLHIVLVSPMVVAR